MFPIRHKFGLILCINLVLVGAAFTVSTGETVEASGGTVQLYDRGGLVWDVQHRLQQLGLYRFNLDGYYGEHTRQAVLHFQRQYGLVPDGIVGPQTLSLLRGKTFTQEEIEMLAKTVYGEARGESLEGQVAVAAVILNRLRLPDFPDTVEGVIFEPLAFTAVSDGQYYAQPNKQAYRAVYLAIQGWDPSEGALYYFNPDTATSDWIWTRQQIKKIGKHIFAI